MNVAILQDLNDTQRLAVEEYEGFSLIVAGAGSGKTRVITYRIAWMLEQGIPAYGILALTFTNKAAKEMKERIGRMVSPEAVKSLWMGTFHSVFARILRTEAAQIGYSKNFTIYDRTDSKNCIRACIKELDLDEKAYPPGDVLSRISKAKSDRIFPQAYANSAILTQEDAAARKPRLADIYSLYAKKCRLCDAMDFDDILLNTHALFNAFPDILQKYARRFRYILVDEYQDTNEVQYAIIKALAQINRNLAVVGDDSQSIYAFRGARIENILRFRDDFPEAREYRLEQNYRSTQTVVDAANSLIAHNRMRLRKNCFSKAAIGEKIELLTASSDQEEAFLVTSSLLQRLYKTQAGYNDFAILYRTNAQSRVLEEALRKRNIPYKVYGGMSFYERAEVKDMLAYLGLLVNPLDDEAFKRVINNPPRGIGATSLGRLLAAAAVHGLSLWETVTTCDLTACGLNAAAANRFLLFADNIKNIAAKTDKNAYELATEIGNASGYLSMLREDRSPEGTSRLQNVEELLNSIQDFCQKSEETLETEVSTPENAQASLDRYLANVALISQLDEKEQADRQKVSLMTVHTAKGLEYDYIYVVGMEENLFPSSMASPSPQEIEEERRLFYVAMTRAKKGLTLSCCGSRFRWGQMTYNPPSRFLKEIDSKYIEQKASKSAAPAASTQGMKGTRPPYGHEYGYRKITVQTPFKPASASGMLPTPTYKPDPHFQQDDPSRIQAGMEIEHERFGRGRVLKVEGEMPGAKAIVEFTSGGCKTLLLKFAKIRIVP